MKSLFRRLVTGLDRLAEVVVFDGLGSTRGRALASATVLGLVAYLGSGFVLTPAGVFEVWPEVAFQAGAIAPFAPVAKDAPVTYTKDLEFEPAILPRLDAWLAAQAGPLDEAVALTRAGVPALPRTPSYREYRDLVNALAWRARRTSRPAEAIADLEAASRLGRAMLAGYGTRPPLLIDGMIAVACFGAFEASASRRVAAGTLGPADLARLVPELRAWRRSWPTMKSLLDGDLAYFDAAMDGWARTGQLPAAGSEATLLRFVMPLAAGARRDFATAASARVRALWEAHAARAERGEFQLPGEPGWGDLAGLGLAPFSRAHALDGLVLWIDHLATPNLRAVQRRLDDRQRALGDLALACLERGVDP